MSDGLRGRAPLKPRQIEPVRVHRYLSGGQERAADWRRFILIDDGSPTPLKIYYDNIISGIDPNPTVTAGDYVSVIGVAGKEVLVPGTTSAEKSVWVRGTGDLVIIPQS